MKKTKRLVSLCVAVVMVMVMTVCPTFAATTPKAAVEYTPTVTVDKVENVKKAGDTFDLTVSIASNQGFTNFEWNIKYDKSRLKLTEITKKDGYSGFFEKNTDFKGTGLGRVVFATSGATNVNGELFTLSFAVKSGAATGDATVEIINKKFENNKSTINATYVPGGVKVEGTTSGSSTDGSSSGSSTDGSSSGSSTDGSSSGSTTDESTTGGSTTGGSTTGGSTTGGSTTGGSTTGGSTTGGSTTGGEEIEVPELDVDKDGVATTLPADTPQESPKTGDTTNMLPWVALVAIGVVGAGAVVIKRREN